MAGFRPVPDMANQRLDHGGIEPIRGFIHGFQLEQLIKQGLLQTFIPVGLDAEALHKAQ
ncbi:hypothetical protein D3C87_2154390 [compost metagenome]